MININNLKPGQKFYRIEWFDALDKLPPFDPPKVRILTYHKPDNQHCGEFIDDTGRTCIYAYSSLSDWYSVTLKEAWERFVKDIEEGIKATNDEIEKQQNLLDELIRQKELANRKVGEFSGKDFSEVSR